MDTVETVVDSRGIKL